ncbi:hypothetical protein IEQ34_021008 [Dendrobium chrysotoxum]|uniref:Uncharacterized protein n=1 Tax=Dendrobium chrysotoxum TaxID=161865 RepID=A0AAV7G1Q3_DENCH|nr:hypothetical protein IEQ34_021008 [Dendrobium chrysotoxum]
MATLMLIILSFIHVSEKLNNKIMMLMDHWIKDNAIDIALNPILLLLLDAISFFMVGWCGLLFRLLFWPLRFSGLACLGFGLVGLILSGCHFPRGLIVFSGFDGEFCDVDHLFGLGSLLNIFNFFVKSITSGGGGGGGFTTGKSSITDFLVNFYEFLTDFFLAVFLVDFPVDFNNF